MLLVTVVAGLLRFSALGEAPPGLYRDEAFNGLDALNVLDGEHALFFPANNGREPAYIYLTALAVAAFGRTVFAVRAAAALAGTLTTVFTFLLGRAWFGSLAGFWAAWLWAVTLWPIHLSRIGLRPILLAPLIALTFWLGTLAFRRQQRLLWVAAGMAYGATFYTYLAARFTPLLLLLVLSYLVLTHRLPQDRQALWGRLWPGLLWFALGSGVALLPLALFALAHPDLFIGRTGQVSILNSAVNEGDLLGTLWRHTWRALGLFLWRGDTILRHNPPGRPVFDVLIAVPFILGLLWCLRRWRNPPAATLLLWLAVMLGPTILAEDAPHYLRAAGLLPAAVLLPAVGLSKIWEWPKLPDALRRGLVVALALGTLIITVRDYRLYAQQPETAYLFEAAARELAEQVNAESDASMVFVDRRYWEGWPSVPFLVNASQQVHLYASDIEWPESSQRPVVVYAWPYGSLDFVPAIAEPPALVTVEEGALARNDLEEVAYPLYVRYSVARRAAPGKALANFDNQLELVDAEIVQLDANQLQVDLYWTADESPEEAIVTFIHLMGTDGLIAQSDAPPALGYWADAWWRPGLVVRDRHLIDLNVGYDATHQQVVVGLYTASGQERLPVLDAAGEPAGDFVLLEAEGLRGE